MLGAMTGTARRGNDMWHSEEWKRTYEMLIRMAKRLVVRFDAEENRRMWNLCLDWNHDHGDEEIFMCEDWDEDGRYRIFIEDDYFYLAD